MYETREREKCFLCQNALHKTLFKLYTEVFSQDKSLAYEHISDNDNGEKEVVCL